MVSPALKFIFKKSGSRWDFSFFFVLLWLFLFPFIFVCPYQSAIKVSPIFSEIARLNNGNDYSLTFPVLELTDWKRQEYLIFRWTLRIGQENFQLCRCKHRSRRHGHRWSAACVWSSWCQMLWKCVSTGRCDRYLHDTTSPINSLQKAKLYDFTLIYKHD